MQQQILSVIEKFETIKQSSLGDAVAYVSGDTSIINIIREGLRSQAIPTNFMQPLFEWLYKCIQQGSHSAELFNFAIQFAPDIVLVYLNAVYESQAQLKASAEVLLLAIVLETEKQRPHTLQVPSLSKPSIYHQSPAQISQSVLTEAALQRHDQGEAPSPRHTFSGKDVTVNNRLLFLSAVIDIFVDALTTVSSESRDAFCDVCIRLVMQGMCDSCTKHLSLDDRLNISIAELSKLKRFSVSDPLIVSLLRGIRICLFQSCHESAIQALQAVKLRAQYELLTVSMQISNVLCRTLHDVHPVKNHLNPKKYSDYHNEGHIVEPMTIHSSLTSLILSHNLESKSGAPNTAHVSEHQQTDVLQSVASRVTSV